MENRFDSENKQLKRMPLERSYELKRLERSDRTEVLNTLIH